MNESRQPRIGDVYYVGFEGSGNEQKGLRPAIVLQNNTGNVKSPNLIVLPLTTAIKKTKMPTHVLIKSGDSGLKHDSMVLCENPQTVSKIKLRQYVTTLSTKHMVEVAKASLIATGAVAFLDYGSLHAAKETAVKLNAYVAQWEVI